MLCKARAVLLAMLVLPLAVASGCSKEEPLSSARRIASRTDLVGGPKALGEIGDFILENDRVRVVIQDKGFSRGFGVYGGSLIDADLVRAIGQGGPAGGKGRDQFGELFPVFFLQALVPDAVEVLSDGSDGGPARVRVRGFGGEFLTMTKALDQALVNSHELPKNPLKLLDPSNLNGDPQIAYEVVYELAPGTRYVKIVTTMRNETETLLEIPSPAAKVVLGPFIPNVNAFQVPVGFVILFGSGNKVFAPGVGYNVRFGLEDAYKAQISFPALPGLLTNGMISTSRRGISYGFFAASDPKVENFAKGRVDADGNNVYEKAYGVKIEDDTMVIPFLASAFTGSFYAQAPKQLDPGEGFSFTTYLVVGDGDAASVLDTMYAMRKVDTGELRGRVRDAYDGRPVPGASVVIYDGDGKAVNQMFADGSGAFLARLPAGSYSLRVEKDPVLSGPVGVEVRAGEAVFVELAKPVTGRISVQVRDASNRKLPAKVSVVGTIDPAHAGQEARRFLFDLEAGQRWRTSDRVPDDPNDPGTLRYIEAAAFTEDGAALIEVPANVDYVVYVSRGLEYDLHKEAVRVAPGTIHSMAVRLKRVVDTTGYLSADFHIHASPSLDSDLLLHKRVVTAAGEGLEYLVATDHNVITDYRPYIERAGLEEWLSSMVGLELTTLESGHFNGYPLRRDAGAITKGSFEWSLLTPDAIFGALRKLGSLGPEHTVVQVNHPRDSILGYFAQYGLDPVRAEIMAPAGGFSLSSFLSPNGPAFKDADGKSTFSFDFDALEVLNGTLIVQIRHATMPESVAGKNLDPKVVEKLPEAGTILCDDGEVAFPGAVDDWFNLLNRGKTYTAVGNSDSHNRDDIGYPRTYVRVGRDDPAFVSERAVVDAVRDHRAILTTGPFVELFVDGQPVGSKIQDPDGKVDVRIRVQAAPWVEVTRGTLIANGQDLDRFDITLDGGVFERSFSLSLSRDTWLVVEVVGEKTLFPVVKPVDVPPLLINDAFSSLTGSFGLGGGGLSPLTPSRAGTWTAYALTNPIWVDVDGGSFDAPGVIPRKCDGFALVPDDGTATAAGALSRVPSRARRRRARWTRSFGGFPRERGNLLDVRVLFESFAAHAH